MKNSTIKKKAVWACLIVAAGLGCFFLFSCTTLPQEVVDHLAEEVKAGTLSKDKFDMLTGQTDWIPYVLTSVISIGSALLGVPIVVNRSRGPISNRKGIAPKATE